MMTSHSGIVRIDGDNYAVTLPSPTLLREMKRERGITLLESYRVYRSEYEDQEVFRISTEAANRGLVYPEHPELNHVREDIYDLYAPILIPLTQDEKYDRSLVNQYKNSELFFFAGFSVDSVPVTVSQPQGGEDSKWVIIHDSPIFPEAVKNGTILMFENTPTDKNQWLPWVFWKGLFVCIHPLLAVPPSVLLANNLICRYEPPIPKNSDEYSQYIYSMLTI